MNRRLKTASHLERLLLLELRRYAICDGITAVTVRESADGRSWEVANIHAPGGTAPPACREICAALVDELRKNYDLLPENQLVPDDGLRLI
jgi:hypothetical protein